MKLQPDKSDAPMISAMGPGWITVQGQRIEHAVCIRSHGSPAWEDWGVECWDQLQAEHLSALATQDTELIIIGCGERQQFLPASWMQPLMERRIGVESMDTFAACRTYNILASEGRKVMTVLMMTPRASTL
jgi:uncharacterized protein